MVSRPPPRPAPGVPQGTGLLRVYCPLPPTRLPIRLSHRRTGLPSRTSEVDILSVVLHFL